LAELVSGYKAGLYVIGDRGRSWYAVKTLDFISAFLTNNYLTQDMGMIADARNDSKLKVRRRVHLFTGTLSDHILILTVHTQMHHRGPIHADSFVGTCTHSRIDLVPTYCLIVKTGSRYAGPFLVYLQLCIRLGPNIIYDR
jgi:hypothetical protein